MPRQTPIEKLLQRAERAIETDLGHINRAVNRGKLKASFARDLAVYTKLLQDLVKGKEQRALKEADELSKMSKEELEAKVKGLLWSSNPPKEPKQEQVKPIFDFEARKKILSETGE